MDENFSNLDIKYTELLGMDENFHFNETNTIFLNTHFVVLLVQAIKGIKELKFRRKNFKK